MADKDYKAFIVEGEAREPQVIDNISKIFFFPIGIIQLLRFRPEKISICYGSS